MKNTRYKATYIRNDDFKYRQKSVETSAQGDGKGQSAKKGAL